MRPMFSSRSWTLAVILGALWIPAAASAVDPPEPQTETVTRLQREALASDLAYRLVESLTVEVGHRFAGSQGDRAAVAWALAKMQELGLANVRTEPVTVPHWVRGQAAGEITSPFPQAVSLIALGGSVGTPEAGVEAEVVEAASLEALEALEADRVEGKIVFLNQVAERTQDGSGYGGTVAIRSRGPAAAAKKGAVALLIRSVGTGSHRFPHTGGTRYADDAPKIPAAALAIPDAELLSAQIGRGEPVRFRLRLTSRSLPEAPSANVIGEIPGRERPEEVVLLGAHLDSWDVGTGAVDDGAGCAIVMAAARRIAELPEPPRRTIRVVLFANEEFGLSGARAYAEAHQEELSRHVLAMESDLGAGRVWRFRTRWAPGTEALAGHFASFLEPLGIEHQQEPARGGADVSPLARARVPVADLTQDASRYFDIHHTEDDTLNKIDREELAQNVAAYATLAWLAADSPESFGPAPELERDFRRR